MNKHTTEEAFERYKGEILETPEKLDDEYSKLSFFINDD